MNELIKELINQSYLNVQSQSGRDITYFDKTKFAELIVQECFEVVINDGRFNDCKGIIQGAAAVAKEHFGVEE